MNYESKTSKTNDKACFYDETTEKNYSDHYIECNERKRKNRNPYRLM
nr:MAG TPA: hypothetical protein [Caudoviricetes sp.]